MNIGNLIQRTKFQVKAHSPEILIVAGIVGTVASTVLACKATLKAPEIIEEHKKEMEEVRASSDEKEVAKETTAAYTRTGMKLVKIYAPAVALGTVSILSIVQSNNILKKRNVAIAAAYAVVDKSFKEYRSRVVDRFGKEVDHQLRYNIREMEIEEKTVDAKGKEKVQKKTIKVADRNAASGFMKYFVRGNSNWANDPSCNEYFFKMAQANANDRFIAKGSITLNEVYEILGFQATKEGMVVGWIYDPKDPALFNRIELDVKEVCLSDENGNFDWGYAIDFNVDGNIYDLMK